MDRWLYTSGNNQLPTTSKGVDKVWDRPTRRDFLKAGGTLAGVSALGLTAIGQAEAEIAAPYERGRPDHNGCLTTVCVSEYGASGSEYQTTGTIAVGTRNLVVADVGDFQKGDGIYVAGAGGSGDALVSTVATIRRKDSTLVLSDAASSSVADVTVQHDDTEAIRHAFAALGNPPHGRLSFPDGLYRTSSTLDFNLGYPRSPVNFSQPTPKGWFELEMVGRLSPVPGIGTAVHVHAGIFPMLEVKIDGGGQWGDYGLKVEETIDAQIEVYAKEFAGTALYVTGTIPDRITTISSIDKLYTVACGRALLLEGLYGFGLIGDVWDHFSTHGSVIRTAADINIGHWENYAPGSQDISLDFDGCAAIHLGFIAVGDSAATLMRVRNSFGVSIDKFYGLGGRHANTALEIVDSVATIANAFTQHARTGIYVKGSSVSINNYEAGDNTNHMRLGTGDGSTEVRANVSALFGDKKATPIFGAIDGSIQEDIVIDQDVTGGYLQLGGNTRNTNTSNSPDMYAVHCHAPEFEIYTWAFRQERSNVAGGIGHPDTSKVILAGGKIDNGVVQTA